jgi:hypothetical protein
MGWALENRGAHRLAAGGRDAMEAGVRRVSESDDAGKRYAPGAATDQPRRLR